VCEVNVTSCDEGTHDTAFTFADANTVAKVVHVHRGEFECEPIDLQLVPSMRGQFTLQSTKMIMHALGTLDRSSFTCV
jgi:hypothetical protein